MVKMLRTRDWLTAIGLFAILFRPGFGQDAQIEIRYNDAKTIQIAGFTMNSEKAIKVEAIGAGGEKEILRIHNFQEDPKNMFVYAWILNARSRKMVWRMTIDNTKPDWWDKYNRSFSGEVLLPKGEYEVYFAAVEPTYFSIDGGFIGFERIFDKVLGRDTWWRDHSEKWKLSISGVDAVFNEPAVLKYQRAVKNEAVFSLSGIGDGEMRKKGFSLKKNADLRLYVIGEANKGEMYDHAWIVNAESRSKIWEMRDRESEHAGGAIKNKVAEVTVRFPAGDYLVYYKSDDTHSYDEWNANPPYDPNFWGITIFASDPDFDKATVTDYADNPGSLILALDRVRDDEYRSQGIDVTKSQRVRVYAVGEGRNGRMYDYGWIEDVRTGRRVWEMTYGITEPAGGSDKNRLFDGVVALEPGQYTVHYRTDDSHSFGGWNTDRPYDPEAWGIRLYALGGGNGIQLYQPEDDQRMLVEISQVGDEEHIRKQFRLERSGRVRIYALGEGDWDEMYDYAWIEDLNNGRTVWRMRYDQTRNAGGSSKNRVFDDTIYLKAGNYVAHYRSDDSHSYGHWNDTPPTDASKWGVTVYRFEE